MNRSEETYSKYALVREMMDVVDIVKEFDPGRTSEVSHDIASVGRLFLTGEGSSRIFPAKNTIRKTLARGLKLQVATDGSRQSALYDLSEFAVFCASNSGRTKEVILLAQQLAAIGNTHRYALTANEDTLLEKECTDTFVLTCGWEQAVAATKSVVEQALFYESILQHIDGTANTVDYSRLSECLLEALQVSIPRGIIEAAVAAPTIFFAGYNDGVAEELTLKTNEITRKKSDFLEGTYAVHGIEEVMNKDDIVFVVDPIDEEIDKFRDVLVDGVGLKVVAISDHDTPFETIRIPSADDMNPHVLLCAGWNLLVEIGMALGIDLDKPERARKVGNEFIS
jgi:glutamine---fructose-6-phosphate transaminase (isomerizing)